MVCKKRDDQLDINENYKGTDTFIWYVRWCSCKISKNTKFFSVLREYAQLFRPNTLVSNRYISVIFRQLWSIVVIMILQQCLRKSLGGWADGYLVLSAKKVIVVISSEAFLSLSSVISSLLSSSLLLLSCEKHWNLYHQREVLLLC